MTIVGPIRHSASIAGRVIDAESKQAIAGARVWLAAPAGRQDQTESARDGHFHFLDLPEGQYTVRAAWSGAGSRYGTAEQNATVENLKLAAIELALPPTAIKGRVTRNGEAVPMATVRILGSGETAYSDAAGNYLLAGLETGTRTVAVTARGLTGISQQVTLAQPGETQVRDLALPAP